VRAPEVLLLDEPTSALDLNRQIAVLDFVREEAARRGTLVVVALHDLNLALRFTDRLVMVGHGALQAEGAPEDTLSPDLLARVYGVEARTERCSSGRPMLVVDGRTEALSRAAE